MVCVAGAACPVQDDRGVLAPRALRQTHGPQTQEKHRQVKVPGLRPLPRVTRSIICSLLSQSIIIVYYLLLQFRTI